VKIPANVGKEALIFPLLLLALYTLRGYGFGVTRPTVKVPYSDSAHPVTEFRRAYQDAIAGLPPGAHVRLVKRTSNLFRFNRAARRKDLRLDVSHFNRVLDVDPETRTAEVQGMTTYEDLVETTLAYGLMPTVVPQLKTITLGGAVTGLGIEASSFRNGLPHESVREMEILTGDGQLIVANTKDNAELFTGFPNSYGTLGYALRLRIDLEPVQPYVHLRHLRFTNAVDCAKAIVDICQHRQHDNEQVDFIDGVVFAPNELYLTLGSFTDQAPNTSDYSGQQIFYQSIRSKSEDFLTIKDYLWRWDTDWFWCSRAFGAQNPWIRRVWPKRWLRSDVYHRLVRFDHRYGLSGKWDKLRGRPPVEDVIQDVEIPVDRLSDFLAVFQREIPISPIWICPIQSNVSAPLYPLKPGQLYVNVGFWSTVRLANGQASDHHNRLIERLVADCGGHKSLYSTVHYPEEEFWQHYNGPTYRQLKQQYDPDGRLLDLYQKSVRTN
jgi:FAD/FMN-containing dehydrogenase